MSKFNFKNNIFTKNKSGHKAYKMSNKEKLATQVLTSFFNERKFYGDNSDEIVENIKKVISEDPRFVANLAIYARCEMNLRSISHVIVSELAKSVEGKPYVRETINKVVLRVDDMTEILSYYINKYGKPIPNSMKKGIADKFLSFDECSLAKYNRKGSLKLRDIMCLVHPKAKTEEQNNMFKRLLEGNLKTPKTWETELSMNGNKKEVWEDLIESKSLGYMAMLRNLRNIIKAEPYNVNEVYETLSNEKMVLKSKQLPYRYYTAYKTLKDEGMGTSKVYTALEEALEYSTKNINKLNGKTFMSTDVSGSMLWGRVSNNSNISCAEIALLFMSMANYICDESITSTFDTEFKLTPMSKKSGIIGNMESIRVTGGGTDMTLPFEYLIKNKIKVDRIILFSDNEVNYRYDSVMQEYVDIYRKKINPDVWIHAIDIQGYGTQQFKGKNVNIISGWSEKVLEFIYKAEEGIDTLVEAIDNYYFEHPILKRAN